MVQRLGIPRSEVWTPTKKTGGRDELGVFIKHRRLDWVHHAIEVDVQSKRNSVFRTHLPSVPK